MYRDNYGRFANLRSYSAYYLKGALFVLVAAIYVPVCTIWVGQQAYHALAKVTAPEIVHNAIASTTTDRRSEIEAQLRPQFDAALQVAIEKKLAEEHKALIEAQLKEAEKQLEEVRAKEMQVPLASGPAH